MLPELFGMKKVVSEDAVRRGFKAIDAAQGAAWLRAHLMQPKREKSNLAQAGR